MDVKTQKKLNYLDETKQLIREAIVEKGQTVTDTDTFRSYAEKIKAIVGSSSADVRYVTFMNEDGTVELGKKAVATGDDCADPIARGIFSTPTKESTDQYNFTFSGGWATTPGGGKDSNALKAVTEDRTVYANFISAVRYYTVTYYDSDGTTVLNTERLAYGSMPSTSYIPEKDGYSFNNWEPALSVVTGDVSYTAMWTEKVGFAGATWEQIAEACSNGTYTDLYALYDKRTDTITNGDGTQETVEFEIVDMNPSSIVPGTHMAILATHVLDTPKQFYDKSVAASATDMYYAYSYLVGTYLKAIVTALPSDMAAALQSVALPFASVNSKLHVPTTQMIVGYKYNYADQNNYIPSQSYMLEAFKNGKTTICKKRDGTAVEWWSATTARPSVTTSKGRPTYFDTSGKVASTGNTYDSTITKYVRLLCFV